MCKYYLKINGPIIKSFEERCHLENSISHVSLASIENDVGGHINRTSQRYDVLRGDDSLAIGEWE